MNLLVIDNNLDQDCWGSKDIVRLSAKIPGIFITTRRGPHQDLPATSKQFDRLVISGSRASILEDSEWAEGLDDLIRAYVDSGKPVLGVCYGHQAIARALLGKGSVRKSAVPEYGWTRLRIKESSRVFSGLPAEFFSFSSHREEVSSLSSDFRVTVSSEGCEIQGFEMTQKPVFGIQFHPEKTLEEAQKTILGWKKKKQLGLLMPHDGSKIFDATLGDKLFANFLNLKS